MKKGKFTNWLKKLQKSGLSEEEIRKTLQGVAKYSGLETYSAITATLTIKDKKLIEEIENELEARLKIEELFKLRSGMTIDELVGKIQMSIIDNNENILK